MIILQTITNEASGFYQSGKIYVVVGVIALIFIGIILYLFRIEKKLKRIEKEHNL